MRQQSSSKRSLLVLILGVGALIVALSLTVHSRNQTSSATQSVQEEESVRVEYLPNKESGLITNEYAHFNAQKSDVVISHDWDMTSGSLFAKDGYFWTGVPDSCNPDARSKECTNSNVFRANTKRKFEGSIKVDFALKQNNDIHNYISCEAEDKCWHGTHLWLRYQNQFDLYYVSVNRADGNVVIKRKVPCGDENGGTYFELSKFEKNDYIAGEWSKYQATVATDADGFVNIKLYDLDHSSINPIATGIDKGGVNPNWTSDCSVEGKYSSSSYSPITEAGSVGIRGDYSDFVFKDFVVTKL